MSEPTRDQPHPPGETREAPREEEESSAFFLLRRAVQELQMQRMELELQNDELQRSQRQFEESRAALAASESRYRELFESAPIGSLRLDASSAIAEANPAAAELFGAEKNELIGRKLTDFIAARDQDAWHLQRQAVLRSVRPTPARVTLRALGGELREVELEARLIAGHPSQLCVAIVDVAPRERARSARGEESELRRRLLADSVPLAIAFVRADGRIDFCNQAYAKLYGRRVEQIEGRLIFEVLDAGTYAALREHLRKALAGENGRFEGRLYFPAIGPRFVSEFFAPYRGRNGQVVGFFALIDDRSELEEARRGLRLAASQAALAEERERRALAADLHDDVGQLVSLLTMKLRALLAEIGDSEWVGQLLEIEELSRQIRRRISSLTFELSPPLLYDMGLVAAAEWLAESLQGRYGLRTEVTSRGEWPSLDEATRVTLFRAIRELLINVARHAGTDRARVEIEGSPTEMSVCVADQGCGFDPDKAESGFGLRSLRDRIESLGGQVTIESAPWRGSKVSLRVPTLRRPS